MRWRSLFVALLLAAGVARASDAIPGPYAGASLAVSQIHVAAELVPEGTTVAAGSSFGVILHLHMDEGWHTYWINPGGAGLATRIKWTLPSGWTAGSIEWPTPESHAMGPIITYGYGGDVYLLTTLRTAADAVPGDVTVAAHADWLVCKEECIPGKADLSLTIHLAGSRGATTRANENLFTTARARLPVANTRWKVTGLFQGVGLKSAFVLHFQDKGEPRPLGHLYFFPEQPNVLSVEEANQVASQDRLATFDLILDQQQNGEKPAMLGGVLVSDQPLIGEAKAVYLDPFSTDSATPASIGVSVPPVEKGRVASAPTLIAILGAAFLGGLILNLMPCVLPVLSLKVFSLIKHAELGGAWKQGLAFAAGVLVSFWVLAGLLIALQAAGNHLGWAFQFQSPGFVLALIFLFFLLGLNLFGVFEFGTSLVGVDARTTSHFGGLASSFANGALATLAATPCTGPYMGTALGFAAQQPAAISMLVFTVLALGMAAPYLVLTTFPGALRLVPKPGPWMEMLKQFMGFLLMGTVIFLVYVFAAQTGQESVSMILGALLAAAIAAWIYGRVSSPLYEPATRIGWTLVALALLAGAVGEGIHLTHRKPSVTAMQDGWQPWSPEAVQQALAKGQPVFVDFTAAWCINCKFNERFSLDIDSTKKAFADKHVVLLRGDWTNSDPRISDVLRQYNRNGVPLYLVYSPREPNAPEALPELLTPGIVQDALQKLP